jgi:single-strand DNA-binding protein
MLNQCQFIGNLGADPEVRTFQNGGKVCNLRLAVNEKWTKDGERKERTEWVTVAIFSDGLVGVAERYLKKGSKVFISGKMQTRKWQDQSGADRYSTEIVLQGFDAKLVMLDGPSNGANGYDRGSSSDPDAPSSHGGYDQSPEGYNAGGRPGNDIDDEIPFAAEWRI